MNGPGLIIIGAGNVGWHFIRLFSEKNLLKQVFVRKEFRASELRKEFNVSVTCNLDEILEADAYLLCVNDAEIVNVTGNIPFKDKLIIHTAGSVPLDILKNFERRAVLYPLQTLSKEKPLPSANIPLCMEASNENDLTFLKNLSQTIGAPFIYADSRERMIMHLAAVIGSNFTYHLLARCMDLLNKNQINPEIIKPLLRETFLKATESPSGDIFGLQTGPAVRNDQVTMKKHLELLDQLDPALVEIYKALSKGIMDKAVKKKI